MQFLYEPEISEFKNSPYYARRSCQFEEVCMYVLQMTKFRPVRI